jgi:CRISPR system Cascade subunit CasB
MSKPVSKSERFVEYLSSLDRAALAVLRRGVREAPGAHVPSFPLVEPFLASQSADGSQHERRAYYLVAGLFALKERFGVSPARIDGNLGVSAGRLFHAREQSPSLERRFINLLDADGDQLPYRIRQVVGFLASEQVPVDWARLVRDLTYWTAPGRHVQQRWARSFYGYSTGPESNDNSSDERTEPESAIAQSDERKTS